VIWGKIELIWEMIAVFLASISLALSSLLFWILRKIPNKVMEEIDSYVKAEEMRAKQTESTIKRVGKTANKMISKDLLENSPIKMILNYLSEETVDYLEEHPEALPEVAKKWIPVLSVVAQFMPQLLQVLKLEPTSGRYEL